ncbi:hypothetical protein M407DRAFT_71903 [Tulasnella calospora MUT 4182]|uniref:Survival protein SurE-like phosphatase/nucleotidase domain-containing protein n=1 Tax=Tulasnella calospora MUT 4182 TaxID=1051891 RepID=A0A0C3L3S2_9AGAM|nr:hypothetical protein M407DRAFT_71903 [Tulasnella calospora MUT 4182]
MSPSLFCKLALGALAVPSAVFAIPAPATFDRQVPGETTSVNTRAGPIKILIGNDDGWAEGNIRQLYADAQQAGHDVVLSAGAKNGSGSSSLNIAFGKVSGAEYGTIPDGAPQAGFNQTDPRLNYFNGTPVAAIDNGFNVLTKKFWGGAKPDLVLSGPNVGSNLGAITLFSGTVGVANYAVKHQSVPAIAFSGGDETRIPYTALQPGDVSHVYSQLAMTITNQVISSTPFLPAGVSLNVNFPKTSANCAKAEDFKFVFTTIYPLVPTIGCTESVRTPTEADVIASNACLVSISAMGSHKLDVDTAKQTTVFNKLSPILSCADVKDHILSSILPLGTVLGRRHDLEDGVAGTVEGIVDTL